MSRLKSEHQKLNSLWKPTRKAKLIQIKVEIVYNEVNYKTKQKYSWILHLLHLYILCVAGMPNIIISSFKADN